MEILPERRKVQDTGRKNLELVSFQAPWILIELRVIGKNLLVLE
jgi:hypothetical protein